MSKLFQVHALAKRAVQIRDIGQIRMVSDPVMSPCGCRVAFVHSQANFEKDDYVSDVWLAELASIIERSDAEVTLSAAC